MSTSRSPGSTLCLHLAQELDNWAADFERVEVSGWPHHLRRDAELLRIRAERTTDDEPESEADDASCDPS